MRAFKAIGLTASLLRLLRSPAAGSPAQRKRRTGRTGRCKVVVPFGAGGAADRLGRIAADHLSKAFKQQFYIENRVGAGGAVASKDVARADARRLHAADRRLRAAHHGAGRESATSATTRSATSPTSP